MVEEVATKTEEKDTSDSGRLNASEAMTPLRWREKLKIHKFKILGGVLGIFVLVGATFAGYQLGQKKISPKPAMRSTPTVSPIPTPASGPTVKWQTYTNTKYGYSIKCPKDFIRKVEASGDGLKIPYHQEICYKGEDQVRVSVMKLLGVDQLDRGSKARELEGSSLFLIDFQEMEIDGQEAISYKTKNQTGQIEANVVEIISRQPGKCISIRGWGEDFFNLTLSTFRFLPSTGSGQEMGYQIFGGLTQEADEDEIEILEQAVSRYSCLLSLLESFPPQFQIVCPDQESCEKVGKTLTGFEFIRSFGECEAKEIPLNPEEPVEKRPSP